MARSGVTYLDVAKAAEAIRSLGQNPTVDRVLAHLGTGSKSTLAPLLKQWKSSQEQTAEPSGLPAEVIEAVKALHERLQHNAEHTVEQAKQTFQSHSAELKHQLAEAESRLETLHGQHRGLEKRARKLEDENATLKAEYEVVRIRAAKLEIERSAAQTRLSETQCRLQDQKQEIHQVREHFEHYQYQMAEELRHERDRGQTTQQRLEHQLNELTQHLHRELKRIDALEAANHDVESIAERLRQDLDQARQDQHALELEAVKQDEAINTLKANKKTLEKRLGALEAECETLTQSNRALEMSNQHLEQRTAQLVQQLSDTADRLTQATQENRQLLQEKADLQGQVKQLQHRGSQLINARSRTS